MAGGCSAQNSRSCLVVLPSNLAFLGSYSGWDFCAEHLYFVRAMVVALAAMKR